jgi:hypothetical protein
MALTCSLTFTMTGCSVGLFIAATWLYESVPPSWRRGDDDWLWLMLPLGAAVGLVLWLRYRRRPWVHVGGAVLIVWLVGSIGWILSLETPPGMQGLGMAIGKAMAAATAQIAAVTGAVSLAIAAAVVAALTWRRGDQEAEGED